MWPFGRKKNELVTVSITPQNLSCSWIEKLSNRQAPYTLMAYTRTPLKQLEFSQAVVFNPTIIKKHITSFLKKHHLIGRPVVLSVSGPKVLEKIVLTKTASPAIDEYNIPKLCTLNWNSLYLCPSQKGGFDFFVCGMKPEHLFSYQLLAQSSGINIAAIVTGKLAQLHLYKHLQGSAFRQNKLSLDLLSQKYELNSLFNSNTIEQSMSISKELGIDINKEYPFLTTNLGLFLSEGTP